MKGMSAVMCVAVAAAMLLSTTTRGNAQAQNAVDANAPGNSGRNIPVTFVPLAQVRNPAGAGRISVRHLAIMSPSSSGESQVTSQAAGSGGNTLPFFTFDARAARDGHRHLGVMVGTDPFSRPGTARIPTQIVPLILHLHSIAVSFDPNTGVVTTAPGEVTLDPTEADNNCLSAPNNVPVALLSESPIFNPASFIFGSKNLGTTQYIDAFMRANFFKVLGDDIGHYHLLLDPVNTLRGVEIDVPANEGIGITNPAFLAPAPFQIPTFCAPLGLVDFVWLDFYLNDTVLPELAEQGVNPATLPNFMTYNTVEGEPVNQLFTCCILGYHSFGGFPTPTQTYAVSDFDSTEVFGPTATNTATISHEVGEWANDPFGDDLVPAWGPSGQVPGCQDNLEVGDPLSGTNIAPVTMPNGFTYQLQELAFFSWFFGGRSIGVNGWFSNNGTFTTDAGPVCTVAPL